MKNLYYFIIFLLFLHIGCGDSTTVNPVTTPIATATPFSDEEVLSISEEISYKTENFSPGQEGVMEFEDINLKIPSDSLSESTAIELAEVNIKDPSGNIHSSDEEGHGKVYEISTGNPDRSIVLNKPVEIQLPVDPNASSPTIAIWGGDQWLPVDPNCVLYDKDKNTVTTYISVIGQDLEKVIFEGEEGGSLTGPINVTAFSWFYHYNVYHKYQHNLTSRNNHFTIHYDNNFTKENAMTVGDNYEKAYDFFRGLSYDPPVNFLLTYPTNNQTYASSKIMVYCDGSTKAKNAWANFQGVIYMPGRPEQQTMSIPHELFHLIQNYYANRSTLDVWVTESTATATGAEGYNQIFTSDTYKYDIPYNRQVIWDGARQFTYSFDDANDNRQYKNGVIWSYFLIKYKDSTFKNLISAIFSDSNNYSWMKNGRKKVTLQQTDQHFRTITGTSLSSAYFEAFEDFYIYGQVYNKKYFVNLPKREEGQPYTVDASNTGLSYYYPFKSDFKFDKNINITYMSGNYYYFAADGNEGNLYITINPGIKENFKVKICSFKKDNGLFELSDAREYENQDITDMVFPFEDKVSVIAVFLENQSCNLNNNLYIKVYGKKRQ